MGLPAKLDSVSESESENSQERDDRDSNKSQSTEEDEEFADAEAGSGDEMDMEQDQSVQLFDSDEGEDVGQGQERHDDEEAEEEELDELSSIPDVCQGMLYTERFNSFTLGGWPASTEEGQENNNIKCSRHDLAMAGLEFYEGPGQAKCVVCHRLVTGLKDYSNAWKAHKAVNPKCPLILMGRPNKPDGYTMEKFIRLMGERQCLFLEYQLSEFEQRIKTMLNVLVEEETGTGGS